MKKEFLTPLAILIGSGVIGLGLYFGLQKNQAASPPQNGTSERSTQVPSQAATGAPTPPPPALPPQSPDNPLGLTGPNTSPEARKKVEEEVTKALEAQRAEFVKKCWDPSFKKNPDPPKAKYIFNVSFDPQGKEIARGISDVRGMERFDTGQCLRSFPMGIQISPPGMHVGVNVELILP